MTIKPAIVKRLLQICEERNIAPNDLAVRAGVTPSTVYSLLQENRKDMSVITFKKLCDGLDITLIEFLERPILIILSRK